VTGPTFGPSAGLVCEDAKKDTGEEVRCPSCSSSPRSRARDLSPVGFPDPDQFVFAEDAALAPAFQCCCGMDGGEEKKRAQQDHAQAVDAVNDQWFCPFFIQSLMSALEAL
jgi:hypothetical protein